MKLTFSRWNSVTRFLCVTNFSLSAYIAPIAWPKNPILCMILRITLGVNRKSIKLRAVSLPQLSYLFGLVLPPYCFSSANPNFRLNPKLSRQISFWTHFYRTKQLCLRGFGDHNSVCLSIRPSVTRVHCDEMKNVLPIFWYTWKTIHSSFLTPTQVDGRCLLPPEICT